jgi:predicted AAA+ superfamily ATPase
MPGIKVLFEAYTPREEVLSGELTDEMFAARLSDVAQGKAHPTYQDPEQFFANTFPTERVQSFLKEVLGRLSGKDPTASAFFQLNTSFGGGKTHTLIALYHLAQSRLSKGALQRLHLSADLLPKDRVKVVTIVGDDLDPANGVRKEGVKVHHLWGELAFQLGGPDGYALVEQSDVQGIAPGPNFWTNSSAISQPSS